MVIAKGKREWGGRQKRVNGGINVTEGDLTWGDEHNTMDRWCIIELYP